MTTAEIQQQIDDARDTWRLAGSKIEVLTVELKAIGCDHPKTEDYIWEHDNGYGRQSMTKGKRCTYCWFVDFWNRGNFIDPSEITA